MRLREQHDEEKPPKVRRSIIDRIRMMYRRILPEDDELGFALLNSEKDRAEHIMLLDLARNDVNRVCQPKSVKVDHLMRLEKFSHVIHLTSQVSGILREGINRYVSRLSNIK
jgi:isochorismate synthase EntC